MGQVDGLLGPETENALQEAVDADEIVCSGTTTGATTTSATTTAATTVSAAGSASVVSPNYENTFTVDSCSLNADVSNISLTGSTAAGLTLTINATEGTGTLGIAGGTEEDGITLNGDVEAVSIAADRSFDLSGTFGPPNDAGDDFEVSGSCPE